MKQINANMLKIESTTIDNFPGDTTGQSIIATSTGSAEKGETAQVFGQGGVINNPSKNTIGLRVNKGSLDIIIGQMNYQVPLPENQGETLLYSTDADGAIKSKCLLGADGTFTFNDGTDFAVRYSALETAINAYATDGDTERTSIITKINTELTKIATAINAIAPGSYTLNPVSTNPVSADITPSKIEEIKVP